MGCLFPRTNFLLGSGIISLVAAVATMVIPFSQSLWELVVSFVLYGFCFGFYETGASVYLLKVWGEDADPFLQALQFAFGLGSLIAPLIAEPFLNNHNGDILKGSLIYPFLSLAGMITVNALFFFAVWYKFPDSEEPASVTCIQASSVPKKDVKPGATDRKASEFSSLLIRNEARKRKWESVSTKLVFLFMHIYLGVEIAIGTLILTFAVQSDLHLTEDTGALLTSLFWGMFTATKVAAVISVQKIGAEWTIILSLVVMMISNILLLPFCQTSETMLTIGVSLMGIGISSIYGCIFAFLDQYMVVSSGLALKIVVSATLGEVTFPAFISLFIDSYPMILMWVSLFCTIAMSVIFLITQHICRQKLHLR